VYRGKFRARVQGDGTTVFLGLYSTELEAARVVMKARKELLGDHAYVDELPDGT
jgi:hypothetical protein